MNDGSKVSKSGASKSSRTGKLYGIGVGPGDPELMTLKAYRLISQARVVAYPAPDTGDSFARSIAAHAIAADAKEIPIVIPMRAERFPAQSVYDQAADTVMSFLELGEDVVTLCEGDPFFYGSFMYLFARIADRFAVEIVPGVSSLGACAAASARPLCARNEVITIIPATAPDDALASKLGEGEPMAIMKVGRHLSKVRDAVKAAGLMDRATYVSHASLPEQRVMPLADAPEPAPYFSMVLIGAADPYVVR